MRRRISSLLILSLLLFAFMAMTAFAAKSPVERRTIDPLINRSMQYSFPDAHIKPVPWSGKEPAKASLGVANPSPGFGYVLGDTWYDYQRNGSMRRMVTWGTHGDGSRATLMVHFTWMQLPDSVFTNRKDWYTLWNAATGTQDCSAGIQSDDEYAGYTTIDVTDDNRAVVTNHNDPGSGAYQTHAYWDFAPATCFFPTNCRVPDGFGSLCETMYTPNETGFIWPASCWQEDPVSGDKILHVFAQESNEAAGDPQAVMYFRAVNPETAPCTWTNEECVDTVYDIAEDCDCTDEGKVVLGWTANIQDPSDPCPFPSGDNCSSDGIINPGFVLYNQLDNDVYYMISLNSGVTWQERVNITKNVDSVEGYRPYTDVSVLITSDNNAHVVWSARYWPADANYGGQAGLLRNRIFHYSENLPFVRVVHAADWDQQVCNGGAWNLNASKQTVSECGPEGEEKLYVLFTQFNDGPKGIFDDCAAATHPGFPTGAANGELYLCISDDWGLTWDEARNLTQTRRRNSLGQFCDKPGGAGGPCPSEHWSSMAKFGTDYVGQWPVPPNIIVPDGSVDPLTYYLDVQYIDDNSAGGIVQEEGYWTNSDVRWFRIPCVEPIPNPRLIKTPTEIDYPSWSKHGIQVDTPLTLENIGNAPLNYTQTIEEDTGPIGWLTETGLGPGGTIPHGLANTKTGTVHINTGGIVNSPGTIVNLVGRLIYTGNFPTSPDTFPISHYVTDTLIKPIWDTVSTSCTRLTVANNGNFGNQGRGGVNLDYTALAGDTCPDADIYVYDGSPVVGYQKDGDTIVNFSIFATTYVDDEGFVPIGDHTPTTDMGEYEVYESGPFVTHDSLIVVEKIWYAPKAGGPDDTCTFMIECIKLYVNTDYKDTTVTGVKIGEAIDFDIPSDSGSDNNSDFDHTRNLIYQVGIEYDTENDEECENDRRFGGIDFLEGFHNGTSYKTAPYGAYSADNPTYVYPQQGFVPEELYAMMDTLPGYTISDSTHEDLHVVMTFDTGLTLGPGDVYVYYVEIVTHWDGTKADFLAEVDESYQWWCEHIRPGGCGCCIGIRGNVDYDPGDQVNVADLTYLVDYLFRGGAAPPCWEEGNVDGDPGEQINVADLTYLVDYLFRGGAAPPPCP